MDILQAIWLGVLQGLTEFLPISSSAHLILMRFWFGWEIGDPQTELVFDVALHVGTLTAIVVYFWRDLVRIAGAAFSTDPERAIDKRLAWGIVVGCIPAALVGALFEDTIEEVFRLGDYDCGGADAGLAAGGGGAVFVSVGDADYFWRGGLVVPQPIQGGRAR